MTNLQQLQENINNILIELTDITGFDHGSKALEAFACCEDKVKSIMQKAYQLGQQDMLERARGVINKNKEIENWSHSVGSHSDDRGGDSDIECTCREKEIRYKIEALDCLLKALDNLT
jgi:hypothetical protein